MFIKCEKCGAVFDIDASLIKPGQSLRCSGCNHVFKYTPAETTISKEEPVSNDTPQPTSKSQTFEAPQPVFNASAQRDLNASMPAKAPKTDVFFTPQTTTHTQPEPAPESPQIPPLSVPEEFKPVQEQPKSSKLFWILLILLALIALCATALFLMPNTIKQSVFWEREIQSSPRTLPALEVVDTSFRIVPDQQSGVRLLVQGALYNPADQTQNTHSFWIELYDGDNTLIYTQEVIPVQKKIMGKSTLPFYSEITPVPDTVKRMDIVFK